MHFEIVYLKTYTLFRGTQRQLLENICSEDDLRSRIFGTFKKWYNCPFLTDFYPTEGQLEFSGDFLLAEMPEKISFDPYNFLIGRLSARKSEQMKNF